MKRGDMTRIASAQEAICTVCATFPCECPSADQYDEQDEDLSDMEIPARVVGTVVPDSDSYVNALLERLVS